MTAAALPNIGLIAGYTDGEDGWGVPMNANLRVLDALIQLRVIDKDLTAPPGSPVPNAAYIVAPSSTGAWAGQENKIAIWATGDDLTTFAWLFVTPKSGWRAWMIDEAAEYRYAGSAWALVPTGGGGSTAMTLSERTASYTLALADANNGVAMNVASANTLTVPSNADVAFVLGTSIFVLQKGGGTTTVAGAGGVSILKRGGGSLDMAGQFAAGSLVKISTNEWVLTGDLAA